MTRTMGAILALAVAAGIAGDRSPAPAGLQQPASQVGTTYGCAVCHADKRQAFLQGTHAERGIRCHDCHGGDPTALQTAAAHRRRFVGSPDKVTTVEVCTSCHSDPGQMRQYGLPADQLAEFRTSRHGQLLLEHRNSDAPTCTDCHDAHVIRPPEDARSTVHPANSPGTCNRCHGDAQKMGKYGLSTDQFERYRRGAHGVAIFERSNFAAPTCTGCHGSHSALPPAVTEITHVCDRCHKILGAQFYRGPHGRPALQGRSPGCLGCHSNHGTERVAPHGIAALCTTCHDHGSQPALLGVGLQQQVVRATQDLEAAERAIEELVRHGRQVTDAGFRYQTALTYYRQIAEVQHNLDLEILGDLTRRVGSISRELRAAAEASAEQRWEHKLLLMPVWFLALAAVALAWFKLNELRRGLTRDADTEELS